MKTPNTNCKIKKTEQLINYGAIIKHFNEDMSIQKI